MCGRKVQMALFNWAEAYSVNVPELDRQHRGLMDLINELHDGIATGKPRAELDPILERLISFTHSHFQSEEWFLRECKYPAYLEHVAEHEELLRKLQQMQNDLKMGRIRMSLSVKEFLNSCVRHHLEGGDHNYVEWLTEHLDRLRVSTTETPQ